MPGIEESAFQSARHWGNSLNARLAHTGSGDRSAALDLIREASEAIQAHESRATDLETQLSELQERFDSEMASAAATLADLDQRIAEADARAEEADARAREAEEWLTNLDEAMRDGFSPFLGSKP